MKNKLSGSRGSAVVVGTVLTTIMFVLATAAYHAVNQSNRAQLESSIDQFQGALIEGIASLAVDDLRAKMAEPIASLYEDPTDQASLNYLLAPNSTEYKVNAPRIFGKGEVQIVYPQTNPAVAPLFVAAESDPQVWIEPRTNPTEAFYRVRVKVDLCKNAIPGRTPYPSGTINAGLGTNWNPGCPQKSIQSKEFSFFINITSGVFTRSDPDFQVPDIEDVPIQYPLVQYFNSATTCASIPLLCTKADHTVVPNSCSSGCHARSAGNCNKSGCGGGNKCIQWFVQFTCEIPKPTSGT